MAPNYKLESAIEDGDSMPVKVAKKCLEIFEINESLNYYNRDTVDASAKALGFDLEWSDGQYNAHWPRVTPVFKQRAALAHPPQKWHKDATKNRTISGQRPGSRPLERIDSVPCPLPILPDQVLIITCAGQIMAVQGGGQEAYIQSPLDTKLRASERLTRMCVATSFNGRVASITSTPGDTFMRHFLVAPMSMIEEAPVFKISRSAYGKYWPEYPGKVISDCVQLQVVLDNGNNGIDTLVLVGHYAHSHTDWVGWAKLMAHMSLNSSWGIGYIADNDVEFERNRDTYGNDALDYIIAIRNSSLQALAAYLQQWTLDYTIYEEFPTARLLARDTSLSASEIKAVRAINLRRHQQPLRGGEALVGGNRYPGYAVKNFFTHDENQGPL